MKSLNNAITAVLLTASLFTACTLDNFDGPDAKIFGEVRDIETGELIQQDLTSGSEIVYVEHGYENPEEQRMNFKCDGTYRNNLMFSGIYDIYFYTTNFQIPEKLLDYRIKKGENKLDFEVIPYVRISGVSIVREGNEMIAKFSITPTVDNNVRQIGFFCDQDFFVGEGHASSGRVTNDVNQSFNGETREYTLKMNIENLTAGQPYYFRVGAIVDIANSRYNYAPTVKITM